MTVMEASSVAGVLHGSAVRRADDPAFTFIDYDIDPSGYAETLTWGEVNRRVEAVAAELASSGPPGARVAILAPQTLDYIIGFLGAVAAGFVAVPLPVPMIGGPDERVGAALRDCSPVAILTTTAAIDSAACAAREVPRSLPRLIELDALALSGRESQPSLPSPSWDVALLQYTSGSTRRPAGVVITHRNILANLEQVQADYFSDSRGVPPRDTTLVSWLPFYHDMGMLLGVTGPVALGLHAVLMTPMAFLQKPARWMQALAQHTNCFTAAPNFAFELAARRTSDKDMAGLDLSGVHTILSGSERIHAATLRRFTDRFAAFNLRAESLAPSYGLAEAMVYVSSSTPGRRPTTVCFDPDKLSAGHAERCASGAGVELVSVGTPRACTVRIVNPETCVANAAGEVGEIWVHGENVARGYWRNPRLSQHVFGGRIVAASPGTPPDNWLRTGDLGVLFDDELFVIGRIKDLLIIDGRNLYPDDIEATIQEITGGRAVAISIPGQPTERLVTIVELKMRNEPDAEAPERIRSIKRRVVSAISESHRVRVDDLVAVAPGSIPITTSGKVRRAACAEQYRLNHFARLDSA